MTPFNLERAKAGDPVVTRDGRKVRLVCFDAKTDYPILALVLDRDGTYEKERRYLINGKYDSSKLESPNDLFMALPEIPEGWTKYDPGVPLPENAEEVELYRKYGDTYRHAVSIMRKEWKNMSGVLLAYRVTKWKIPDGYIRHDGGPCPVDFDRVDRVFAVYKGNTEDRPAGDAIEENWNGEKRMARIIAYKLKPQKPSLDDVIEKLAKVISKDPMGRDREHNNDLLRQFAEAIKNEIGRV